MFGWNWPCGSRDEDFSNSSMYFRNFVIISPWKYEGSFIWTNLNPLYPRMLCFMFGMNWPSGFGEEDENVKSLRQRRKRQRRQRWRRRTTDKFWSEKLIWAFSSGELKRYNINFSYISKTPYCWVYNLLWKEFRIFSNLLDFQRVGTTIIHEWTGVAVLCCHGKVVFLLIRTSKVISSCSYGQKSFKTFDVFSI